jgi:hypothetical protein
MCRGRLVMQRLAMLASALLVATVVVWSITGSTVPRLNDPCVDGQLPSALAVAVNEGNGLQRRLEAVTLERDALLLKVAAASAASAARTDVEQHAAHQQHNPNEGVESSVGSLRRSSSSDIEWAALEDKLSKVKRPQQVASSSGRPKARVVLITALFRQKVPAYFPMFLRSLEHSGADAIILGGDINEMPALPPNVMHVPIGWPDLVHIISRKLFGGNTLNNLLYANP